ncbi:MAG: CoA transferase, partial [Acidobacteria bacterium]|nr:CoA transferase [Acidobacteriota bacterium]
MYVLAHPFRQHERRAAALVPGQARGYHYRIAHRERRLPKPLDGIRVIDLTWVLAGPHATRILADFGADVIKVESLANRDEARAYAPRPFDAPLGDRDPDRSGYFANFNRSKRAMTLNLKNAHGLALFKRLVAVADVVIENFSATVMTRFGLDYEGLSAINPRIIYISMAGFGHAG